MTPGPRRFGRRALLVGTAGVAGALVVTEASWPRHDPGNAAKVAPATPVETSYLDEAGQTVDLTVRWQHLERRLDDPDLLGAWQFDEGSGYVFDDVSGNDHPLHLTGTAWNTSDSGLLTAIHRQGLRGGCVYLDGGRWLVSAPTAGLVARTGLTLSCSFRPDTMPGSSATLVAFGTSYLLTLSGSGAVTLSVTDRSASQRVVQSPSKAVLQGQWNHVTATVSPATGILRLYVNGEPVARAESQPFALRTTIASLVLGGLLKGAFDEVAIHRVVLSEAKVRRQYIVGLPKVFTQTSESIDADRSIFTHFKGSDPIPHPVTATTVLTHRFAGSTRTEQGVRPQGGSTTAVFVPGPFGGAWRATTHPLTYPSPLSGDRGTFEAWYQTIDDLKDSNRQQHKEILRLKGSECELALYTRSGRWQVDVRRRGGRVDTIAGRPYTFGSGNLEHIAVTWGPQSDGGYGVALYANGIPAAFLPTEIGETSFGSSVALGGTQTAPAYALIIDVRICDATLLWGDICPRGHAATDAAGLDLRDWFDRPPGAQPMLWRPSSNQGTWYHRRTSWERPTDVGADPNSPRALFQEEPTGLHAAFHPDAFGQASSIESGVAFAQVRDGWAGVFVHARQPDGDFSGVTFMLNPQRGRLRLGLFEAGQLKESKVLPHDFGVAPQETYEITLTSVGDGVVRGFVDGSNLVSMTVGSSWPDQGWAGVLTDDTEAFFSNLHFCALTPARAASRVVRTRVLRYGEGAAVGVLGLVPFRWHKRRGRLPWQYTFKDPEPAGNIAGADTPVPPRPISPAAWRSEDSANSDLIALGGRMLYFMRGNPRVDNRASVARVGVLHVDVESFDGIHFTDPNDGSAQLTGGTVLVSGSPQSASQPVAPGSAQLNEPSTAYVGAGRLLFFGRESSVPEPGEVRYGSLVFSRFDVRTETWEHKPLHLPWSQLGPLSLATPPVPPRLLHGTPEVVSLRRPDDDTYQAVIFQQTGPPDACVMATALLDQVSTGVPSLAPGAPVRTSLSRVSGEAIYGFRVLFDNGIYYLHYNEGAQVPDWPDRFVLAAALDPYAGPWVENAETLRPESTYFRRGEPFDPDNGAIWQGTMVKHRGRYYLYYENFHAVDDVDQPYQDYSNPQAGSRVGFATA